MLNKHERFLIIFGDKSSDQKKIFGFFNEDENKKIINSWPVI